MESLASLFLPAFVILFILILVRNWTPGQKNEESQTISHDDANNDLHQWQNLNIGQQNLDNQGSNENTLQIHHDLNNNTHHTEHHIEQHHIEQHHPDQYDHDFNYQNNSFDNNASDTSSANFDSSGLSDSTNF